MFHLGKIILYPFLFIQYRRRNLECIYKSIIVIIDLSLKTTTVRFVIVLCIQLRDHDMFKSSEPASYLNWNIFQQSRK